MVALEARNQVHVHVRHRLPRGLAIVDADVERGGIASAWPGEAGFASSKATAWWFSKRVRSEARWQKGQGLVMAGDKWVRGAV